MRTLDSSKATPRPWRLGEGGLPSRLNIWAQAAFQVAAAKRPLGADSIRQVVLDNEAIANAALIVAAVNAYDKAREECLRQLATHNDEGRPNTDCICDGCKLAREVLRMMEGDK